MPGLISFRTIRLLGAASMLLLAGAASAASSTFHAGKTEILHFNLAQPSGPEVEYFISKTEHPAGIILFLQGSGCTPVFLNLGTAQQSSTVYNFIPWAMAGKYAIMVVNKPYGPAERPAKEGDGALSCPRQFNDYFSLDSWVHHLRLALAHARKLPFVDARRMLVFGVSEGATVAAALAGGDPGITDVALVGASGPTQLFDFVLGAYKAPGSDTDISARLDELDATRKQIFAKPDSTTDFAWGHTYKRWSSFFRGSSSANLLKSQARVYIASGMQDRSVPILSTESMLSELQAAGRDVTMRRVPDAGHSLLPDGAPFDLLDAEYARILRWYERTVN